MASASAPVPSAQSDSDLPRLVAPYLPSTDDDDDDDDDFVDNDTSFLADDSLDDSVDDWSDDRPDSSDDSDPSSDSDDCSAAWNTSSKSKHHAHSHSHLHKKSSFHSACDYLSFFGALRKGFCSRPLDQRIEVSKTHKRADKSTLSGGGESALHEKKRFVMAGVRDVPCTNRVSAGFNHKDHEVALSLNAMFKCTVADSPKILFKRANPCEDSDEMTLQDINAHEAGAENVAEKDLAESDKKFRQRTERENVPDVTMVLECDGNGFSKKSAEGARLRENISKDMTHKEYGEAPVESRVSASRANPFPITGKSKKLDEKLNLKDVDKSSNVSKISEKRNCSRESDNDGPHNKGRSKPAMSDCSNKPSKNPNQVALVEMINVRQVSTLESQEKDCVSLEKNASPQSQDSQRETTSSRDNLCEPAEMVDVPTSLDKKVTQSEVSTDKTKLQDMPLHIYIKEKHQPEVVVKDPKRRAKAKKVKASKGKKLHLFRDGFTLPSAIELAEDAESTPPVLDKQSESNNKVQSPKTVLKTQILKEAVTTSATEDDAQPPIIGKIENVKHIPGSIPGNAIEEVDGVPPRDSTGPAATLKSIKTQLGNPISNDSDQSVVTLPGSVSKGFLHSSASYLNIQDGDTSKTSFTEGRNVSQPHSGVQFAGFAEVNIFTSMPPSPLISNRRWFPQLDVALHDPVPAPELVITSNGSPSVPDPLIDSSLATTMLNYSSTALLHEPDPSSESFENFQGNLLFSGYTDSSASLTSSSFIEAPSTAYHLGKRVVPRAMVSSSSRIPTMDIGNSRFLQVPLSQNQAFAPNSVPTMSLQQEINPPALFNTSTWIQPGANSGLGFSFPLAPTTNASFGQVICCNNQTLSMYKQMKSFSIEARYLVNVPSIVPGCCKLFLFNIESRQLHGVYVSSSLQAMAIDHEFPVAFDCIENYSLPLSVGELDTILPEAKQMNGRPLLLQHHTVEQLVTMLERKNKSRLSWVPSTTNPVSVSAVHGLMESSAIASESFCTQDHLVEAMVQGSSLLSAIPASLATNEVAKDCWSPLSNGSGAIIPESRQAHEPDSQLTNSRVFPFPASSVNNVEEAKAVWPEVPQIGFTRKPPEQGVAPSPMALWPHLFPKASSADTKKESFMHMETRDGNSTQSYNTSVFEALDRGSRPDSESDAVSYSTLPESGIRSNVNRPKLAYNPLALEQRRQRHLFDGSKSSNWSTLASELDFQQISQYGNRPSSQENNFTASLSSALLSEQLKMSNTSGAAPTPSQLPLHFQMDHSLPDILRNDLGLSKTCTAQTTSAWNEEPHLMHPPTTSEIVPGAANFDQTNLCCYCFTRRADHLIIDCQHLGPCLECAASKKIEFCGQLNCQTKVTRLLRLFRPV